MRFCLRCLGSRFGMAGDQHVWWARTLGMLGPLWPLRLCLIAGGMAFMHVANVVLLALMFRSGHFSTATESLLSWFGLKK